MYNFFNTNIINPRKRNSVNDSIEIKELINKFLSASKNISDDYLNNTSRKIDYLGEGINGSMYKVMKTGNNSAYYIIKLIEFNKSTYSTVKKELGLLKKIESNALARQVINPCLDYYLSKNKLITVFNSFDGTTLLDFINKCHHNDIDKDTKKIILKYIIKQCFHAIYQIHRMHICHLQINPHSILIKLNVDKLDTSNNINTSTSEYTLYNNTNTNLDESSFDKDKLKPTNYKIYTIEDTNEPIQVKLTNFGLGCGILPLLDTNLNISSDSNTEVCNFYNTDPYLKETKTSMSNIDMGMHYDFFNVGLIGVICLCDWEFVKSNVLNSDVFNRHILSIKTFEAFLDMCRDNLFDDTLMVYFDNIRKYCLGPLSKRKNSKFVQEKIILDEKHDDDSMF